MQKRTKVKKTAGSAVSDGPGSAILAFQSQPWAPPVLSRMWGVELEMEMVLHAVFLHGVWGFEEFGCGGLWVGLGLAGETVCSGRRDGARWDERAECGAIVCEVEGRKLEKGSYGDQRWSELWSCC